MWNQTQRFDLGYKPKINGTPITQDINTYLQLYAHADSMVSKNTVKISQCMISLAIGSSVFF